MGSSSGLNSILIQLVPQIQFPSYYWKRYKYINVEVDMQEANVMLNGICPLFKACRE